MQQNKISKAKNPNQRIVQTQIQEQKRSLTSDNQWVSLIHVVPKKTGFIVVKNEKEELIPTRVQNSWRVCINYRRLNQETRKDHFPLPFID